MQSSDPYQITHIMHYYHYLHDADYEFAGHRHAHWELNVLLDGSMEVTCDEYVFRLSGGDLLLLPAGSFHRNRVVGERPADMLVVHFLAPDLPSTIPPASTMTQTQRMLLALFCQQPEVTRSPENRQFHAAQVSNGARKLLELFLEYCEILPAVPPSPTDPKADLYHTAVNYLTTHLNEPLTLPQIARACGVGLSTLKDIFTHYAGMGCMQYFTELRLDRAGRLLDEGMSCAEVSRTLGFSSQAYFSKRFRQFYGVPPSKAAYRMR